MTFDEFRNDDFWDDIDLRLESLEKFIDKEELRYFRLATRKGLDKIKSPEYAKRLYNRMRRQANKILVDLHTMNKALTIATGSRMPLHNEYTPLPKLKGDESVRVIKYGIQKAAFYMSGSVATNLRKRSMQKAFKTLGCGVPEIIDIDRVKRSDEVLYYFFNSTPILNAIFDLYELMKGIGANCDELHEKVNHIYETLNENFYLLKHLANIENNKIMKGLI